MQHVKHFTLGHPVLGRFQSQLVTGLLSLVRTISASLSHDGPEFPSSLNVTFSLASSVLSTCLSSLDALADLLWCFSGALLAGEWWPLQLLLMDRPFLFGLNAGSGCLKHAIRQVCTTQRVNSASREAPPHQHHSASWRRQVRASWQFLWFRTACSRISSQTIKVGLSISRVIIMAHPTHSVQKRGAEPVLPMILLLTIFFLFSITSLGSDS